MKTIAFFLEILLNKKKEMVILQLQLKHAIIIGLL